MKKMLFCYNQRKNIYMKKKEEMNTKETRTFMSQPTDKINLGTHTLDILIKEVF